MQTVAETTAGTPSGLVLVPENRSAWMAVRRLARSLQSARSMPFPLLHLYGGPGTGKTHLLQFLQDSLSEEVTRHYLHAADWPEIPSDELRRCRLLIVEDLQHLPCRVIEDLKATLDYRLAWQQFTVFSAIRGPAELENLPAFLANRLAGGLMAGIEPFSRASRRILLQELAKRQQRPVTPEVLDWLAEHTPGSCRQLHAALQRIEMLAGDSPEPLDISALAALFETEAMEHVISAERIVERVARAFHVGLDDIRGQDRQSQIVRPRQLSMYLARKWTGLSLAEIGQYFGGRDHSTVRHACQKVETSLQDDAELRSILRQLEAEMGC